MAIGKNGHCGLRFSGLKNATSSQDGDLTVVQHTVRVDPAAGRQ